MKGEEEERTLTGAARTSYLVRIELSFLAEALGQVLGRDLLLCRVVLALAEEMLVLNLHGTREESETSGKWEDMLRRGKVLAYLVGLDDGRLGPNVELRLRLRSDVAVEERVGAMASHGGRVPVLDDSRSCSNTTA